MRLRVARTGSLESRSARSVVTAKGQQRHPVHFPGVEVFAHEAEGEKQTMVRTSEYVHVREPRDLVAVCEDPVMVLRRKLPTACAQDMETSGALPGALVRAARSEGTVSTCTLHRATAGGQRKSSALERRSTPRKQPRGWQQGAASSFRNDRSLRRASQVHGRLIRGLSRSERPTPRRRVELIVTWFMGLETEHLPNAARGPSREGKEESEGAFLVERAA